MAFCNDGGRGDPGEAQVGARHAKLFSRTGHGDGRGSRLDPWAAGGVAALAAPVRSSAPSPRRPCAASSSGSVLLDDLEDDLLLVGRAVGQIGSGPARRLTMLSRMLSEEWKSDSEV